MALDYKHEILSYRPPFFACALAIFHVPYESVITSLYFIAFVSFPGDLSSTVLSLTDLQILFEQKPSKPTVLLITNLPDV
jgi:hypothetical protein